MNWKLSPFQAGLSHKPCIPTHQTQARPYERIPAHRLPPLPNHQPRACGQLASAPDCGQCKQPLFTGNPVDLAEAAFDKHLQRNQIRSIPTLALFVNGREVARQLGAMRGSDIVRWTLENIPG